MNTKNEHIRWLLMAGLMVGGMGCGADDEAEDNQPVGCVKTEFSLVVPQEPVSRSCRMTAGDVQAEGTDFRGITDLRLYPFETKLFQVEDKTLFTNFSVLSNISAEARPAADVHSLWFRDMEVPVGTNTFLAYGVAKNASGVEAVEVPFRYGYTLTTFDRINMADPVTALKFTPATIQTQQNMEQMTDPAMRWALSKYTQVVNAATEGNTAVWWSTSHPALAQLYRDFVFTGSNGGVFSASSRTLLALFEDLYNRLSQIIFEETNQSTDANAIPLAQAIMKTITDEFLAENVRFKIDAQELRAATSSSAAVYKLAFASGADPDFPLALNLPDGVVALKVAPQIDGPATVAYQFGEESAEANSEVWDIYAYPPQLFYFSNTSIGTSVQTQKEKLSSAISWNDFIVSQNFPDVRVSPLTRSIVLDRPLQYGVGVLTTKVQLAAARLDDYYPDDAVTVDFSSGLLWTGLLVADQKEVGWNFTREAAGVSDRSYTVYDRQLNGASLDAAAGAVGVLAKTAAQLPSPLPNYTLVYPTKKVEGTISGTNTDRVHLVLEFQNGNTDFHGAGGTLIPAHTRFYIPALLDLSKLDAAATQDRRQIFESGYSTKVTLVVNDLRNAYTMVPDLRTVKSELGISVYVAWGTGFDFELNVQ